MPHEGEQPVSTILGRPMGRDPSTAFAPEVSNRPQFRALPVLLGPPRWQDAYCVPFCLMKAPSICSVRGKTHVTINQCSVEQPVLGGALPRAGKVSGESHVKATAEGFPRY